MKNNIVFLTLFIAAALNAQVEQAEKLIVSISTDWNSNEGTLYLFDKTESGWQKTLLGASVHYGKAGLAWGVGLHNPQPEFEMKKEGDKRSPAGIFSIGAFYGLDTSAPEGVRYPYHQLNEKTRCIDDEGSSLYNTIVNHDSVPKDWKSAERMWYVRPDYKYVLVVDHNPGRKPGKGSCIFFHINNVPTTGCTSMDESTMLKLLRWLDPTKKTFIVQLPRNDYIRLQSDWKLPSLPSELP